MSYRLYRHLSERLGLSNGLADRAEAGLEAGKTEKSTKRKASNHYERDTDGSPQTDIIVDTGMEPGEILFSNPSGMSRTRKRLM